jgi:hypothetical protein
VTSRRQNSFHTAFYESAFVNPLRLVYWLDHNYSDAVDCRFAILMTSALARRPPSIRAGFPITSSQCGFIAIKTNSIWDTGF